MPQQLKIRYVGGTKETHTLDDTAAQEAVAALNTQQADHIIRLGDELLHINMRNVCSIRVSAVKEEEPEPTPTPEPAPAPEPEAPAEPAPEHEVDATQDIGHRTSDIEQPAEDTRNVADLKAALDAKGVEYPSSAKKADLQELAKTNGV